MVLCDLISIQHVFSILTNIVHFCSDLETQKQICVQIMRCLRALDSLIAVARLACAERSYQFVILPPASQDSFAHFKF